MSEALNTSVPLDYYYYRDYWHQSGGFVFCPSLGLSKLEYKKFAHVIAAVVRHDEKSFKELLDSPKWYNVKDKWGYTLLQIAILLDSEGAFEYMLSLEDFPVDTVSRDGETPLEIALTGYVNDYFPIRSYYAYELLKRDVRVDHVCKKGRIYLHDAFIRRFIPAARLLIEKGSDVNAQDDVGATPLHYCVWCCKGDDLLEGVTMLLCYGADPLISTSNGEVAFDCLLRESSDAGLAHEILFYYTFDEYSSRTISLVSLLEAACKNLPFFYELIEKISTVNCSCTYFIQKNIFNDNSDPNHLFKYAHFNEQSLQNIDLLINKFGWLVIKKICEVDSSLLINSLIDQGYSLSLMSEIVCYFLSYGMTITTEDFHLVYKKFGFCELFKILLQMDGRIWSYKYKYVEIIPALFYDVEIYNIETYLQNTYKFYTRSGVEELLSYSAHPKLKKFCYELNQKSLIEKANNLPDIPLLVELARDVFREYFIKKFNIKTFKQFHMMLKMLPISVIHRKIVTFETNLY